MQFTFPILKNLKENRLLHHLALLEIGIRYGERECLRRSVQ